MLSRDIDERARDTDPARRLESRTVKRAVIGGGSRISAVDSDRVNRREKS